MVCPKCCQTVQVRAGECCPICGFPLQSFRRNLQRIYTLNFAFFCSTLVYSGLVYYLATRGQIHPTGLPAMVTYVMLALAVLDLGIARRIGPPLAQVKSIAQIVGLFTTRMAIVEVPVVFGVGLFFMTGSLQWYVTFLAISWVGFVLVGIQMPQLAQRMAELALDEAAKQ
jgi:hypothetical protein